jgi:hypothetical protein
VAAASTAATTAGGTTENSAEAATGPALSAATATSPSVPSATDATPPVETLPVMEATSGAVATEAVDVLTAATTAVTTVVEDGSIAATTAGEEATEMRPNRGIGPATGAEPTTSRVVPVASDVDQMQQTERNAHSEEAKVADSVEASNPAGAHATDHAADSSPAEVRVVDSTTVTEKTEVRTTVTLDAAEGEGSESHQKAPSAKRKENQEGTPIIERQSPFESGDRATEGITCPKRLTSTRLKRLRQVIETERLNWPSRSSRRNPTTLLLGRFSRNP